MRTLKVLSALVVLLSSGCISWSAPVQPPRGLLVTNYRAPLTVDTNNTPSTGKVGTASTYYVREPVITGRGVGWGDASVQTAAEKAGLSKVHYADYEMLEVLTIFGRFTVRVHGE